MDLNHDPQAHMLAVLITLEENVDDEVDKESGHSLAKGPQRLIRYAAEPTALTGY